MVFSDNKNIKRLLEISNELSDLGSAMGLLSWDQEVMMPEKGAEARASVLATMAGIYHDKLTRAETGRILEDCERDETLNEADMALVREIRREFNKATKLPKNLIKELSETTSKAYESWQKAKKLNKFELFSGDLEKLLNLKIQAAELIKEPGQSLYDVMIDEYEEGLTEKEIEEIFGSIREELKVMIKKISLKTEDWGTKVIDVEKIDWGQYTKDVVTLMGYDWKGGRMDTTAHPFEISIGYGDVRITVWREGADWKESLMAAMHEAGHALYEQGVDKAYSRTHLGGGQGLVIHESQSRLWENMVGRSREFWSRENESLWKAVNAVKPSPIRVLADEVTYGMHIILRFEIERDLIAGKIKVADLPVVWNKKMIELLGIEQKNDTEGVLQDVHWSHGSFGYFPTYFLGTMAAAQFWNTACRELDLAEVCKTRDLVSLKRWLNENIHKYGRLYKGKELIMKVTGESLNPKYFIDYINSKFL